MTGRPSTIIPGDLQPSRPTAVAVGFTLVALVGLVVPFPGATSFVVNLVFVCVGPGYAILGPRGLARYGPGAVTATSLSVSIIVSLALLYTDRWDATAAIVTLATISLAGPLLRLALALRGPIVLYRSWS